jgi:hypothetical protein
LECNRKALFTAQKTVILDLKSNNEEVCSVHNIATEFFGIFCQVRLGNAPRNARMPSRLGLLTKWKGLLWQRIEFAVVTPPPALTRSQQTLLYTECCKNMKLVLTFVSLPPDEGNYSATTTQFYFPAAFRLRCSLLLGNEHKRGREKSFV